MPTAAAETNPLSPTVHVPEVALGKFTVFCTVVLLGVSFAFNGMDRQVFAAFLGPINKEFGLTLDQGALINNAFIVTSVIAGAFSGWCLKTVGRKATFVGGLIAYSAFTFLIPFATNFQELAFYRAMTGAGEALQISAIFTMLGAYFGSRRGVFIGIANAFFGFGAFLGPFLGTRVFAVSDSWRIVFVAYGVAGIVVALAALFMLPTRFTAAPDSERSAGAHQANVPDRLLNRNVVLVAVSLGFEGWAFFAFSALYATYLRTHLGFSVTDAGAAFGMYGLGTLIALVGGWLGEMLKRGGLLVALAVATLASYFLFHDVTSLIAQCILSFVLGAALTGYTSVRLFATMQRSVQSDKLDAASALSVPSFYLPGLFAGWLFGALVPLIGWSSAGTISVMLPLILCIVATLLQDPKQLRGA